MKKNLLHSFIAMLFLTLAACSSNEEGDSPSDQAKAPTADFSFSGTDKPAPAEIIFENKSTNATSYLWDFGDGETSIEKNPTHTFLGGTYTVKLTSISEGGTSTVTKNIDIALPPTPTTAKITKVTVTEMPFTDRYRDDWDDSNGPDVQFFIVDTETYKEQISSPIYKDLLKSQLPLSWTDMTPKVITDLSKEYDVSVAEIDPDSGDDIATKTFKLIDYTTGPNAYPTTITFTHSVTNSANGTDITTIVLDITWQ